MARKIFWTAVELQLIAQELIKLGYSEDRLESVKPSVISQVQGCLGPSRARSTISLTACMRVLRHQLRPYLHNALAAKVVEKPPAEKPCTVSLDQAFAAAMEVALEPVIKRLKSLEARIDALSIQPEPMGFSQELASRPKLPHILVVGPLNAQVPFIEKEFTGRARLHFIESGRLNGSHFTNFEAAVLWTKFCQHAHQDLIKKCIPRILWANGGIESIKEQLNAYLTEAR